MVGGGRGEPGLKLSDAVRGGRRARGHADLMAGKGKRQPDLGAKPHLLCVSGPDVWMSDGHGHAEAILPLPPSHPPLTPHHTTPPPNPQCKTPICLLVIQIQSSCNIQVFSSLSELLHEAALFPWQHDTCFWGVLGFWWKSLALHMMEIFLMYCCSPKISSLTGLLIGSNGFVASSMNNFASVLKCFIHWVIGP